jgi:hypothetical protein
MTGPLPSTTTHSSQRTSSVSSRIHQQIAYLPAVFVAKLDKLQTSVARRTENALMDPVWKVTHTDCNRLKNTLFEYTKALKEREILPGTARYHHRSIAQVHQAAEGLSTRQGRPKHISYCDDCGCRDCVEHKLLVNELESRMKKATDSVKWCLLCLKGGRCSKHPPATTK